MSQPFFVGPEVQIDELGDGRPGHHPPVDQSTLHEGSAEGGDGGAVYHRLVQVEEGRLHRLHAKGIPFAHVVNRVDCLTGA